MLAIERKKKLTKNLRYCGGKSNRAIIMMQPCVSDGSFVSAFLKRNHNFMHHLSWLIFAMCAARVEVDKHSN